MAERVRRDRRRWYFPPVSSYAEAVDAEWLADPLGAPGRALWVDIDRYLEFVAIARTDGSEDSAPARAASGQGHAVTYLRFHR